MLARTPSTGRPLRSALSALSVLCALSALPLLSACSDGLDPSESQLVDSRRRWADANVKNYSMVLVRAGGVAEPVSVLVTVANGAVSTRTYVDSGSPVPAADAANYPNIEGLFDLVQDGFTRADAVNVTFDGTYGYPVAISIDYEFSTLDDNVTYSVNQFTVLD